MTTCYIVRFQLRVGQWFECIKSEESPEAAAASAALEMADAIGNWTANHATLESVKPWDALTAGSVKR